MLGVTELQIIAINGLFYVGLFWGLALGMWSMQQRYEKQKGRYY